MSEALNKRPLQFQMAGDILSSVEVGLKMGKPINDIQIDIADQLTAVWKDGRDYGYNEAVEDAAQLVADARLEVDKGHVAKALVEDVTNTFVAFIASSIRKQLTRKII